MWRAELRSRSSSRTIATIAVSLLLGTVSLDAQETFGVTSEGETGLLTLSSAHTLPRGTWSVTLAFDVLERTAGRLEGESEIPYREQSSRIAGSWGLSDRLELSFAIPYVSRRGDHAGGAGVVNGIQYHDRLRQSGFGNARVSGRWKILDLTRNRGTFAVGGHIRAPTGSETEGISNGDHEFGAHVAWSVRDVVVNVGYSDRGDAAGQSQPDEITGGVGLAHSVSKRMDLIAEAIVSTHPGSGPRIDDSFDLSAAARIWTGSGKWAITVGVRSNLSPLVDDTTASSKVGVLFSVSYFPALFDLP